MPITPISQYRGQDNSLAQILKGGTDTISGILNQAIQLGRDRVNNQYRQDDQLNQMRATETALAQRRGENLTSLIQDNRKMAQNQSNVDRQYARLETQDALNQSNADRQFGFNQDKEAFDRRVTNQELGFKQRDEQRDVVTDTLNQTGLRLSNEQKAQDLANPNSQEGGMSVSEQSLLYRKENDAKAAELATVDKEFTALATDEEFVPDQKKKAVQFVKEYSTKKGVDEQTGLGEVGTETQKLYSDDKYTQKGAEENAIYRAKSFDDYFAGVDKGLDKTSPDVIAHYKRLYELGKKKLGVQSNTGANGAPGVLPNKEVDPLQSARDYLKPSLGQ